MKKRTCNKTAALCGLILLAISSAVLGGCGKSEILAPDAKTVLPSYPESIDQEKDWDKWRKNQDENEVPQSFIESQSGFTFTTARELLGRPGGKSGLLPGEPLLRLVSGGIGNTGRNGRGAVPVSGSGGSRQRR